MKLTALIHRDFLALMTIRNLMIIISVFFIIGGEVYFFTTQYIYSASLIDIVFIALAGPILENYSLIDNIRFLLPQMLLFVFLGNFFFSSFHKQMHYDLIRISSVKKWLLSKVIISLFFILVFNILAFCALIIVGSLFLTPTFSWSELSYAFYLDLASYSFTATYFIFQTYFILVTTTIALVLVFYVIAILTKNFTHTYVIILVILSLIYVSSFVPISIVKWLPSNLLVFSRHYIFDNRTNLTLTWNIIYNFIISFAMFRIAIWKLKEIDFGGE